MNAIFMHQTLQTRKGRYLGCTIKILMEVSLLFIIIIWRLVMMFFSINQPAGAE